MLFWKHKNCSDTCILVKLKSLDIENGILKFEAGFFGIGYTSSTFYPTRIPWDTYRIKLDELENWIPVKESADSRYIEAQKLVCPYCESKNTMPGIYIDGLSWVCFDCKGFFQHEEEKE